MKKHKESRWTLIGLFAYQDITEAYTKKFKTTAIERTDKRRWFQKRLCADETVWKRQWLIPLDVICRERTNKKFCWMLLGEKATQALPLWRHKKTQAVVLLWAIYPRFKGNVSPLVCFLMGRIYPPESHRSLFIVSSFLPCLPVLILLWVLLCYLHQIPDQQSLDNGSLLTTEY